MGFTVEDMLIIARDKYEMKLIAGENGWANSISWLLMIEDTTITQNFKGKELAVTTGLGFETEDKMLELVKALDKHHAAGLIVNTGFYVMEVPKAVADYCDSVDLPLMTAPWNVEMSEMIKDLTVRIFLQTQTDEQISAAFIKAIERPGLFDEYKEELSAAFDVDGKFQMVLFTTDDLDSMDSMDRKRVGYRLQIYLENITHNGHFFYYDGNFILVLNAVDDVDSERIIKGFGERAKRRMPEKDIYTGIGTAVYDVSRIHTAYERAVYAVRESKKRHEPIVYFDDLGVDRILYSIHDKMIIDDLLVKIKPLTEYDDEHNSDLVLTLFHYLKYNGSVSQVSANMFIHKNTIVYRMNKIKELLGTDLDDGEQRLYLYLACVSKLSKY